MTRLLVLAPLLLAGCVTPQNCQRALTGLTVASDIAAVLQARGVAVEVADKIASALVVGQVTLAAACAASGP